VGEEAFMRIIMQSTCFLHFNHRDMGKVGDVSRSVTNSNTFLRTKKIVGGDSAQ